MLSLPSLLRAARQSQASIPLKALAICVPQSSAKTQRFLTPDGLRLISSGSQVAYSPVHIEDEPYCRQRQLITLGNRVSETAMPVEMSVCIVDVTEMMFFQVPVVAPDTWIAPNAVVVGDVDLFDKVSFSCFS